jgi:O-antigen ligase
MASWYRKLWIDLLGSPLSYWVVAGIFLFTVGIPATIAVGLYNPWIMISVFIALAALAGLILFFDVRAFGIYILPLTYLVMHEHVTLAVVILFLIAFAASRLAQSHAALDVPYPLILALLLLAGLNGWVRAVDPDMGRVVFVNVILQPIIIYLIFYNIQPNTRDMRSHLMIIALACAVIGWISLAMWAAGGDERTVFRWGSQNPAAVFFGMILPFTILSLVEAEHLSHRLMWVWILLGITAGILVAQTRAVLLSTLVATIYLAMKDRRVYKVMLPVLLLASVAVPGLIAYRLALMFGLGSTPDWSSVGRIQIWSNSVTYIPHYYLTGMGIDSFKALYKTDFPFSFIKAVHPHNIILKWIFDYGILGLSAYIAIIYLPLKRSFRAIGKGSAIAETQEGRLLLALNAGIISAILANMVDATLHNAPLAMLMWTMIVFQLLQAKHIVRSTTGSSQVAASGIGS